MSSASDKEYYVQRGGSVKGPYSLSKLQSGLASGKLRDSDGVAANKSGPWQPLGRWIRNATASEDDDSDDLIGQPYEDETCLDDLVHLMRDAKPLVRPEDTASERSRLSLRQRIEESGVEVDWDVLLGNLKKLAFIVGGIAAAGMILWFGLPMASRAVQDTIQQVNEFQEAVAQFEAIQPAVEAHDDNDTPGRKSNDKPQKEGPSLEQSFKDQILTPIQERIAKKPTFIREHRGTFTAGKHQGQPFVDWSKIKYDASVSYDIVRTNSLLSPYVAQVHLTLKKYSEDVNPNDQLGLGDYRTRDAVIGASWDERTVDVNTREASPYTYAYSNGQWTLVPTEYQRQWFGDKYPAPWPILDRKLHEETNSDYKPLVE